MNNNAAGRKGAKPRISVGKIVLIVLAVLIAYCCIFSLAAKFIRNESVPMPLGFGVTVVLTGSMEPTLSANDLVFVAKSGHYSVGDVVVYQTGGTAVIHRIIEAEPESGVIVTMGDANDAPDEPVLLSKVKGKMLFKIPFIGFAVKLLKTVPGIIMTLILLFTLLFLSVRAREQDKTEETKKSDLEVQIEELRKMLEARTEETGEKEETEPEAPEIDKAEEHEGTESAE